MLPRHMVSSPESVPIFLTYGCSDCHWRYAGNISSRAPDQEEELTSFGSPGEDRASAIADRRSRGASRPESGRDYADCRDEGLPGVAGASSAPAASAPTHEPPGHQHPRGGPPQGERRALTGRRRCSGWVARRKAAHRLACARSTARLARGDGALDRSAVV